MAGMGLGAKTPILQSSVSGRSYLSQEGRLGSQRGIQPLQNRNGLLLAQKLGQASGGEWTEALNSNHTDLLFPFPATPIGQRFRSLHRRALENEDDSGVFHAMS